MASALGRDLSASLFDAPRPRGSSFLFLGPSGLLFKMSSPWTTGNVVKTHRFRPALWAPIFMNLTVPVSSVQCLLCASCTASASQTHKRGQAYGAASNGRRINATIFKLIKRGPSTICARHKSIDIVKRKRNAVHLALLYDSRLSLIKSGPCHVLSASSLHFLFVKFTASDQGAVSIRCLVSARYQLCDPFDLPHLPLDLRV